MCGPGWWLDPREILFYGMRSRRTGKVLSWRFRPHREIGKTGAFTISVTSDWHAATSKD
ncbi:hypothetical protein ACVINI_003183 [Rhizobium beringeri]|jgi:hypothetical protein